MDKITRELFDCVKLFALYFDPIVLGRLINFCNCRLGWSTQKIVTHIDTLIKGNKITIEEDVITINQMEVL